ncbi:hypothetical protein OHI65_08970 [Brucella sp. MAB-22]|uniref:hypothetical protein n=1 Tax=Brucella sp. MAB-22 TaxID=2986424 RepID=UPI0022209397|nr:hypothetical protein [Brucella sp. MAB-22]UYT54487.1 hypothetical protein OHI65_08970 [Brucella sp. MAB-22]
MYKEISFQTEVDGGFHLPTAYRSHARQLDHMVAIATLIAGSVCAAILAVNIFG